MKATSSTATEAAVPPASTRADSLLWLAADEARINRAELDKLYTHLAEVTGEVRYLLLWRVSQLERVCRELDWLQTYSELDRHNLRRRISAAVRDAVVQRREARRLILSARHEREGVQRTGRSTRTVAVPAGTFTPTARPSWATP